MNGLFDYLGRLDHENDIAEHEGLKFRAHYVRLIVANLATIIRDYHPFFTLHDVHHCDAVADYLYKLVSNAGLLDPDNPYQLNHYEIYYLLVSAYLHDIGMFWPRTEDRATMERTGKTQSEVIRSNHHERVVDFIEDHWKRAFLFEGPDTDIVIRICKGHRIAVPLDSADYNDEHAHGRNIKMRLLAGLLRVADELDLTHTRISSLQLEQMERGPVDPITRRHWMKHYYTQDISFGKEAPEGGRRRVRIYVHLQVPDDIHAARMKEEIRTRFNEHLEETNFPNYGFEVVLDDDFAIRKDPDLIESVLNRSEVRILFIDDDEDFRTEVPRALERIGYGQCEVAADAIRGLAKAGRYAGQRDKQPHIIVLDNQMESLDGKMSDTAGVEAVEAFQRVCPNAQIVIFTGTDPDDANNAIARALQLGAEVIRKDRGPNVLAERLEEKLKLMYIIED
jgi:CheY-like chemotaxis protein